MNVHVSVLQEEEIKIGLESEIIQGGGTVSGDYIPVPSTAEVGQTIVVKAVDENGKPTEWEPVDAADAAEIGARLSSLANDLSDLAPAGAAVGQLFRVAAISEDGKYTMEPVDMLDVQINGESIVKDRVANIPLATNSSYGVVRYNPGYGLKDYGSTVKYLGINPILNMDIDNRQNYRSITGAQLDYAVKAAMCDGKGAAWTAEEQAAARERMAVENGSDFELLMDATLEEEANIFKVAFPKPVRECLYHIWFYNNNGERVIAQTKCLDHTGGGSILRYSSSIQNGIGYALNGYFRYSGNIYANSIVGYASDSTSSEWTTNNVGNGSLAYMNYPHAYPLRDLSVLSLELINKTHVLNVGAKIQVWGR